MIVIVLWVGITKTNVVPIVWRLGPRAGRTGIFPSFRTLIGRSSSSFGLHSHNNVPTIDLHSLNNVPTTMTVKNMSKRVTAGEDIVNEILGTGDVFCCLSFGFGAKDPLPASEECTFVRPRWMNVCGAYAIPNKSFQVFLRSTLNSTLRQPHHAPHKQKSIGPDLLTDDKRSTFGRCEPSNNLSVNCRRP